MSRTPPPEFQIAALQKKKTEVFDPMAAGPGTVWEDRGTHGTLAAFLKTCVGSMTNVGTMTRQIRRPETTADARPFVIGCCICWAVSAAVHGGIYFWRASRPETAEVHPRDLAIELAIFTAAAGFGAYFLFRAFNAMWAKMIAQEKDAPLFPGPLIYNVTAYAMGPSLLAVVPLVGPPVAFLLIGVNAVRIGIQRFRLRFAAAMIDAVLGLAAVIGLVGVAVLIGYLIFFRLEPLTPVELPPVPGVKPPTSFLGN